MKRWVMGLALALALVATPTSAMTIPGGTSPTAMHHVPGYAKPLPVQVWGHANPKMCYTSHDVYIGGVKVGTQYFNRCGPGWNRPVLD